MKRVYKFGPFELREAEGVLLREGEPVPIRPKVLETLLALVSRPGELITRAEFMEAVWQNSFVEDGNLSQNISVLRKILSPDFPDSNPIDTVSKLGYRFRIPVQGVDDEQMPPENIAASAEPSQAEILSPASGRFRVFAWSVGLTAGLILVITLFAAAHFQTISRDPTLKRPVVAILRFRNLSPAPDDAWLSIALREMLSTDLTAGTNLQVIPEEDVDRAVRELGITSTDGINRDTLSKLCADLGCSQVLTASYLINDDHIQLDLHLLDVRTGAVLAAESFAQPKADLRALIADSSQSLRHDLRLPPRSSVADVSVGSTISVVPEAYRLYIEGTDRLQAFDLVHAFDLLQQSVALDPNFAPARSSLALTESQMGQSAKAADEADRAVALAGNLPREDQLVIQAHSQEIHGQFDESAKTYRILFDFRPEDIDYGLSMVNAMDFGGHMHEALAEVQTLMRRPGPAGSDPRLYKAAADACTFIGDWQCSLDWAQKAVAESKRREAHILYGRELVTVAQAQLHMFHNDKAASELEEAIGVARTFYDADGELNALVHLGELDYQIHNYPEARALLEQALDREEALGDKRREPPALQILSAILCETGQPAQAVNLAEREVAVVKIVGFPPQQLYAQFDLAMCHICAAQLVLAENELTVLMSDAERLQARQPEINAHRALAEVELRRGEADAGLSNIQAALALSDTHIGRDDLCHLYDLQARLWLFKHELSEAKKSLAAEQHLLGFPNDQVARGEAQSTGSQLLQAETKPEKHGSLAKPNEAQAAAIAAKPVKAK